MISEEKIREVFSGGTFFWQLIYAGPIVRFIFRHIFRENEATSLNT